MRTKSIIEYFTIMFFVFSLYYCSILLASTEYLIKSTDEYYKGNINKAEWYKQKSDSILLYIPKFTRPG